MSDLLSLLKSKNRCLGKFLSISEDFLARVQASTRPGKDQEAQEWLAELGLFESRRDSALRALELYDRKISELASEVTDRERTPGLIERVKSAMNERETIVQAILKVDLELISRIEKERSRLMRDMSSARKAKDTLSKFKSGWIAESGEGLDEKL
jgi:hypothetical protein